MEEQTTPARKSIIAVLHDLQVNLKVGKDKVNTFSNFNYRNADQILDAVKSLLPEDYAIVVSDSLVSKGNRVYIKSTVILRGPNDFIDVVAFARETETKKGMDDAQVTGAASSYAKKYALQNLFALSDPTDDPDGKDNKPAPPKPAAILNNRVTEAITKIDKATTVEQLSALKGEYQTIARDSKFQKAALAKFKELTTAEKTIMTRDGTAVPPEEPKKPWITEKQVVEVTEVIKEAGTIEELDQIDKNITDTHLMSKANRSILNIALNSRRLELVDK
jgi:hypothetical protein